MGESKLKEYFLNLEEFLDEFKKKYATQIEALSDILHENMFILGFDALYNEGMATFARKRYKRSIFYFEKALAEQPRNFNCLYNLALSYQHEGDFETAIKYYLEALNVRDKDIDAIYNIGLCYLNIQDGELAEKYISQALERNPNDIGIKMSYTLALIANEQVDDAIEHTIEIVKSNKTYMDFTLDVAKHIEAQSFGEKDVESICNVIRLLNSYIKLKPKSSQAHLQASVCYGKIGNWTLALKHSLAAYEINPKSFEINSHTGLVLYCSHNYDEALKYYEKALFLNPIKNFETNYNIALTYEKLGRVNDFKSKIEYIANHFADHPKIGALEPLKQNLEIMIEEAKNKKVSQPEEQSLETETQETQEEQPQETQNQEENTQENVVVEEVSNLDEEISKE